MAADLSGMFAQMNKAILAQPLASGVPLDVMSKGVGNLAGTLSGGAIDNYSMMTPAARQSQGRSDLGQLDMNTVGGMENASKIYSRMGQTGDAVALSTAANVRRRQGEAELEQGRKDINEQMQRTRMMAEAKATKDIPTYNALAAGVTPKALALAKYEQGLVENRASSEFGEIAEDMGYFKGTPEYTEIVKNLVKAEAASEIVPLSPAGKIAADLGLTPGTQSFQSFIKSETQSVSPVQFEQLTKLTNAITSDPRYVPALEQQNKAKTATILLKQAIAGNPAAMSQLEASLATFLSSSVRAQSEIIRITKSDDLAGRFLNNISKGITGLVREETLGEYGDIIASVIKVSEQDLTDVIQGNITAAIESGIPSEVGQRVYDMYGVSPASIGTSNWEDR